MQTDAEIRREPLLTWKATEPASHPVDYFVPNFGVDHEIIATQRHEKSASKTLGAWNPKQDKDGKWIVPTEDASFKLVQTDSQINMEREPLLTWKATEPASHPVDYFVPNFGVDHEIVATQNHEKLVSKALGAWNPKQDKDGKWIVPTEDAFFKL